MVRRGREILFWDVSWLIVDFSRSVVVVSFFSCVLILLLKVSVNESSTPKASHRSSQSSSWNITALQVDGDDGGDDDVLRQPITRRDENFTVENAWSGGIMRYAAISIPSVIADGGRRRRSEFIF